MNIVSLKTRVFTQFQSIKELCEYLIISTKIIKQKYPELIAPDEQARLSHRLTDLSNDVDLLINECTSVCKKYEPEVQSGNYDAFIEEFRCHNFTTNARRILDRVLNMVPPDLRIYNRDLGISEFSWIREPRTISGFTVADTVILLEKTFASNTYVLTVSPRSHNCSCGTEIKYSELNEFACDCGIIHKITSEIDNSYDAQKPPKTKTRNQDSNNHCQKWLIRIQALEQDIILPEILTDLEAKIRCEFRGQSLENMTCTTIRGWLKEMNKSKPWNKHIPLIRKLLGQRRGYDLGPPQLTEDETRNVLMETEKDLNCYDNMIRYRIIGVTPKNKPYYPYIIFQNIRRLLCDDPRVKRYVKFIHFQREETVKKDDEIYQKICRRLGKTFRGTDEHKLLIYPRHP